jgi:hypothetical protein
MIRKPGDANWPEMKSQRIRHQNLTSHSAKIELLDAYSKFLEKHGYLDTDWRDEFPTAIDQFMNLSRKPKTRWRQNIR